MLLRIFKTSQPLSWILIVFILISLRLGLFIGLYAVEPNQTSIGLLENWLLQFNNFSPWTSHFLSTTLVIFSGFYFNKIAQEINILKGIHYLLFLFTGIFLSFYPCDLVLSPMLISTPILLFSYQLILTQSKGSIQSSSVFNSAFFIGFASLIFFPSITLLFILLFSMNYISQPKLRHYVIGLIGFLTPWLFHDALVFTFNTPNYLKLNEWPNHLTFFDLKNYFPMYVTLAISILVIFQAISYFRASSRSIIKIQKSLTLNFLYLLITCISVGFFTDGNHYLIGVIAIPISILFSVFHLETKKWWLSDLTTLSLLAILILNYYMLN